MALTNIKTLFSEFLTKLKGGIVNNCASTSTTLPLSANQGKALQDQITTLNDNLSNINSYGYYWIENNKTVTIKSKKRHWFLFSSYSDNSQTVICVKENTYKVIVGSIPEGVKIYSVGSYDIEITNTIGWGYANYALL